MTISNYPTFIRFTGILAAWLFISGTTAAAGTAAAKLDAVANSPNRTADQIGRNKYRHPVETLTFFGIQDNMTVVELWPFGGWYTSILAPFLREHGKYYAAAIDPDTKDKRELNYNVELKKMFDSHPAIYDKAITTALAPGSKEIAPAGSADMVLTFRNIHNWHWAKIDKAVFAEAYRALKPGGILGVVEHRANTGMPSSGSPPNAYVHEDYAIPMIESAGFKLLGKSDINNNPKDTKDYPVWSLPPNYMNGDKDRAKYEAIGESDRFTLKFIKPVD